MNIAIRGIGFRNKGAELMLHAILQEISGWPGDHRVALDAGTGTWTGARTLNVSRMAVFRKRRLDLRCPKALLPDRLGQSMGLMAEQELDVVLEASGYAFGDPWRLTPTQQLTRFLERWKTNERRFVMLPQAFGPFERDTMRQGFNAILRHADLAFARDRMSFDFVRELAGDRDQVRLAPDFTNIVEGRPSKSADELRGQVCLIPNFRMLDRTDAEFGRRYRERLIRIARRLQDREQRFFVLLHDTGRDRELAEAISAETTRPTRIVHETDPRAIKGIIGGCSSVIGSRFHGLVSALSQGVPVVAMGWSHKYRMLLEDYGCEEQLVRDGGDDEALDRAVGAVLDSESRHVLMRRIAESVVIQKTATRTMWSDVRARIGVS